MHHTLGALPGRATSTFVYQGQAAADGLPLDAVDLRRSFQTTYAHLHLFARSFQITWAYIIFAESLIKQSSTFAQGLLPSMITSEPCIFLNAKGPILTHFI